MARKGSEPAINERSYRLADGSLSRTYSVRYFDRGGVRRRVACASREEADFERARIVLERTSLVELAEQLGHAPTMTLNTYAHVFAEHRRDEPVDVDEWIRRARTAAAPSSERPPGRQGDRLSGRPSLASGPVTS